jgi:hypothetical protein
VGANVVPERNVACRCDEVHRPSVSIIPVVRFRPADNVRCCCLECGSAGLR